NARVDRQRTTQLTSKFFRAERANEIMDALVSESLAELAAQGYRAEIELHRALEMRYLGQNYELELPLTLERFADETIEQLWTTFHDTHKARFGFSTPGEIIEIVNFTVTAVARPPKPPLPQLPTPPPLPTPQHP